MSEKALEAKAKRVLEAAHSYRRGIRLSAMFGNGQETKEVFYASPADIPIRISHYWNWLYLYSVCLAEKRQYPSTEKIP